MPDFLPTQPRNDASSFENNLCNQLRSEQPHAIALRNSIIPNLGAMPPIVVNVQEATRISSSLNKERSEIQGILQLGDSIIDCIERIPEDRTDQTDVKLRNTYFRHPPPPRNSARFYAPVAKLHLQPQLIRHQLTRAETLSLSELTRYAFSFLGDSSPNTLLSLAISENRHNAVARSIVFFGANGSVPHNQFTPLMLTAYYNNPDAARILLTPKLFNWTLENNYPPGNLDYLAYDNTESIHLDAIDLSKSSRSGTALTMWLEKGNMEIAELLISRGAEISKYDFQLAAHNKHTKIFEGYIELLRKSDPRGHLSLYKWAEKGDTVTAIALYPYVGITEADLDSAAEKNEISTLKIFMALLQEKSIHAIEYLRAKHPLVADSLKLEADSTDWRTFEAVNSGIDNTHSGETAAALAGDRSQVDQLSPEVIQSIKNFEKSKDFEHLGAMRESLVSFAQQHSNPKPSVAIQQEWKKI